MAFTEKPSFANPNVDFHYKPILISNYKICFWQKYPLVDDDEILHSLSSLLKLIIYSWQNETEL